MKVLKFLAVVALQIATATGNDYNITPEPESKKSKKGEGMPR